MPTYIDGIPIFMCGGKMKYDLGGMMMPGGMADMSPYMQDTQSTTSLNPVQAISGASQEVGNMVDNFANMRMASNSNKPYSEKSVTGAFVKGISSGGMLGGIKGLMGAYSTKLGNDASQEAYQQRQQDMLKQQLISNLPGQSSYVPTFENGGTIKQTEPWYRQIPNNVVGWWEHNKPQLMKDLPIIDPIAPILDYIAGKSDTPVFPVSTPNNLGNLKPSSKYFDKIVHYSDNPNLKYTDIDLTRVGSSQMKKRYKNLPVEERPGGFYTTKNPKDIFMGGNQGYETYISKTSRVKDLAAEGKMTDRIPLKDLKGLKEEGFDIIKGKNMIGKEEWIPLNKNKLVGWNKFTDNRKAFKESGTYANGGEITDRVSSIDNGSSHEASPFGGVPIGQNALLEKDEFIFKNKAGKKYVFSNKIFR
jgi:hypothetical protein